MTVTNDVATATCQVTTDNSTEMTKDTVLRMSVPSLEQRVREVTSCMHACMHAVHHDVHARCFDMLTEDRSLDKFNKMILNK